MNRAEKRELNKKASQLASEGNGKNNWNDIRAIIVDIEGLLGNTASIAVFNQRPELFGFLPDPNKTQEQIQFIARDVTSIRAKLELVKVTLASKGEFCITAEDYQDAITTFYETVNLLEFYRQAVAPMLNSVIEDFGVASVRYENSMKNKPAINEQVVAMQDPL